MVDFNINLVKSMVSTPEQRAGFYNKMLVYLVSCAALMVGTAYLSSTHILSAAKAIKARNRLVLTMSATSDFSKSFFKDPEEAYQEFRYYAEDLEILHSVFKERSRFLPVMSQLFADFPDKVALQELNAKERYIEFEVVAPVIDDDGNDVLRMLQTKWRENEILGTMTKAVTAMTSERQMVGDTLVASVTYKCILK